ncbi:MAG: hypothetical protein JXR20_11945 [Balneola sp.]
MRKNISIKSLILLLTSILIVSACSDDSPSGEPPSIPDLSSVRPSFDFFNQNNKAAKVAGENFQLAQSLTFTMESLITGFSSLPESFIQSAQNEDAELIDDVWTWDYSASGQGSSISIKLTAEETNSQVNWAMYLSVNTQEQSFENYKFFDGHVKNEGKEGEWNFYSFEEESTSAVMTYDWLITSETEASFNITFDDASFSTMSYNKNTPDNTLTINGDNETTVIFWNSSTGTGYFDTSGEDRVCWDSSSNNTPCTGA